MCGRVGASARDADRLSCPALPDPTAVILRTARFLQLDVFCHRAGGGNPLGVVVDAHDWSDAAMQAFAAWTDLVETTFVLPPPVPEASYGLRIFTPSREIPFAGHPSVGSAHAVLELGLAVPQAQRLVQSCGAGLLGVRIDAGPDGQRQLSVQAPAARIELRGEAARQALAKVLHGVTEGPTPPACVAGGRRWWVAEFDSEAAVRRWQPDHAAIARLARASDTLGLCVFARSHAADHDLVVRAFPAGVGIVEDPASGAANGLLAAYLADCEPDGRYARGYRVSQGREIGRDAHLVVRIDGGDVWVGGAVQTVVSGVVHWPQD